MSGTLALIGGGEFGVEADHHRPLFGPGTTVDLLPTALAYEAPGSVIAAATARMTDPPEVRALADGTGTLDAKVDVADDAWLDDAGEEKATDSAATLMGTKARRTCSGASG